MIFSAKLSANELQTEHDLFFNLPFIVYISNLSLDYILCAEANNNMEYELFCTRTLSFRIQRYCNPYRH